MEVEGNRKSQIGDSKTIAMILSLGVDYNVQNTFYLKIISNIILMKFCTNLGSFLIRQSQLPWIRIMCWKIEKILKFHECELLKFRN